MCSGRNYSLTRAMNSRTARRVEAFRQVPVGDSAIHRSAGEHSSIVEVQAQFRVSSVIRFPVEQTRHAGRVHKTGYTIPPMGRQGAIRFFLPIDIRMLRLSTSRSSTPE
jgi:hypothetical protein